MRERPEPGSEAAVEHCGLLVPEVAQEPPEPRGAARHAVVVRNDERLRPDPGATRGSGKPVG
jgi:hypothetical protein